VSSSPPPGPYQRGKGPPASPVSQRAFSTPFLPRLSAEPEKLPEIPALPLNFAPREKQKEKKQEQATLSADWEPRGSGAICGSICGGLGTPMTGWFLVLRPHPWGQIPSSSQARRRPLAASWPQSCRPEESSSPCWGPTARPEGPDGAASAAKLCTLFTEGTE